MTSCMTLAYAGVENPLLDHLIHAIAGPAGGTLTVRKDGGTFDVVTAYNWSKIVPFGEIVRIGMSVRGDTVTIYGPYGEVVSKTDPRIGAAMGTGGKTLFWQSPSNGPTKGYMQSVDAYVTPTSGRPAGTITPGDAIGAGMLTNGVGHAVGAKNRAGETRIGRTANSYHPGISMGATEIICTLQADAVIGVTSIQTEDWVFGTVKIGSGADEETVIASGFPAGTGSPFTTTVTALTKNHAKGAPVISTPPASKRADIYHNQGNDITYVTPIIAFENTMYIGSSLDVSLSRGGADILDLGTGDGLRVGYVSSVANLPTASPTYRGVILRVAAANGTADTIHICMKTAGDTYTWVQMATG